MNDFKETPRERSGTNQRVTYRQGYYGLVKTLVRFQKWDVILDGTTIPVYDRPEQQAWRLWATGLAQASTGQVDKARATLREMSEHVKKAEGVAPAARRSPRWSSKPRSPPTAAIGRRRGRRSARRPTPKPR